MRSTIASAAAHAIQVFVAVIIATGVEPWVTETLPKLPQPLVVLLVAMVGALLVEIASVLVFARPRVHIVWMEEQNPRSLDSLSFQLSPAVSTSLSHTVELRVQTGSVVGWLFVRSLTRSDATISVRLPAAPVIAVVDRSPRDQSGAPTVAANDDRGVDLSLKASTVPRDLWSWAEVRFEAVDVPSAVTTDVIYRSQVSSSWAARFAARVVGVGSDVTRLRFRGN